MKASGLVSRHVKVITAVAAKHCENPMHLTAVDKAEVMKATDAVVGGILSHGYEDLAEVAKGLQILNLRHHKFEACTRDIVCRRYKSLTDGNEAFTLLCSLHESQQTESVVVALAAMRLPIKYTRLVSIFNVLCSRRICITSLTAKLQKATVSMIDKILTKNNMPCLEQADSRAMAVLIANMVSTSQIDKPLLHKMLSAIGKDFSHFTWNHLAEVIRGDIRLFTRRPWANDTLAKMGNHLMLSVPNTVDYYMLEPLLMFMDTNKVLWNVSDYLEKFQKNHRVASVIFFLTAKRIAGPEKKNKLSQIESIRSHIPRALAYLNATADAIAAAYYLTAFVMLKTESSFQETSLQGLDVHVKLPKGGQPLLEICRVRASDLKCQIFMEKTDGATRAVKQRLTAT
eukprot:TRINITY_DN9712_c0_g1_i1.p1 TRINITY_DN9712_c0_g1~~TRINITY_DN9712_c0_g1_i1.p1  ORF type:complete len:400 (+),score=26.71 TRINITY_DN9712_c0_g1_i1:52-1251(+)